MARPLKPFKIDSVVSKSGRMRKEVLFDRNKQRFFVELAPGERVEGTDLNDVKRRAKEMMVAFESYEWSQLIYINFDNERGWHHGDEGEQVGFSLAFRRFERAPNPLHAGSFLERPHPHDVPSDDLAEGQRAEHRDVVGYRGPDKIGSDPDRDGAIALLEYDEAVWEGLCALKRTIEDARDKISMIVRRKDVSRVLKGEILVLPPSKSSAKRASKKETRRSRIRPVSKKRVRRET